MLKLFKPKANLIVILLLSLLLRVFRLDYPHSYVFDEVYHGFTAGEYLKGNKAAWEWWTSPPPGVAYEWTHPPLAKEIMAFSMWLTHTSDFWAFRLPGTLLGTASIFLLYLIGKKVFKKESVALLSTLIFSLDGLNFVQSRVGMNDIYLVSFSLASVYFLLEDKFFLSAIFWGLALSSKWTAVYLLVLLLTILLKKKKNSETIYFFTTPLLIYLLSYIPFFLMGHSFNQFRQLQDQMWYYHTHLRAVHDYASSWWSWPFNLVPVWYFVQYHKDGAISNIFAVGNPVVFWGGVVAVLVSLYQYLRKKIKVLLIPLLGYFIFWLPWAFSPRIAFLYHYSPSLPFMSLLLGYQLFLLNNQRYQKLFILAIVLIISGFLLIYPLATGVALPKSLILVFFRFNLAKNPF